MRLTIYSHFVDRSWTGEAAIAPSERHDYETLERIFHHFNRIDEDDARRLELMEYDLPSLSVGDLVTLEDGRTFLVEFVGFSEVTS